MRINDQKRERVWVGRKFSCDRFKRRGVGHVSALARRDDVAGDAARFSETFAVIGVGSKRARCSHDRGKNEQKLPPISGWPWAPRVPRHPPKPPTSSCWWINWIACCRQSRLRADHALSRWKASMRVWVYRFSE